MIIENQNENGTYDVKGIAKETVELIASREHQAVQAFGEKVLEELCPTGQNFIEIDEEEAISVITSLMKGTK